MFDRVLRLGESEVGVSGHGLVWIASVVRTPY